MFWEEEDYRDFLAELCEKRPFLKVNNRAKLAKKIGVTSSFVTKLLSRKAHLSAEHIEKLAKVLEFNEHETLAFLDKLLLCKTNSPALKEVIKRRLQISFSSSFEEVQQTSSSQPTPPANVLLWKLASQLTAEEGKTISQLAKAINASEARTKFLFGRVCEYFPVEKISDDFHYRLKRDYKFEARQPGSQNLFELGMGIRRMATMSLESRHPIHLVDGGEHYVAGSYILPLTKRQIKALSVQLAQMTNEVVELAKSTSISDETQFVGLCFDMFDYEI